MPRIADIIFCMNATSTPERGMCANGIITTINPDHIPGSFKFSTVVTFLGLDTSRQHRISVRFFNDADVLVNIDSLMPVSKDNTNLPDEYKGMNLKMDWSKLEFKTAGEYTLTISVDGELLGEKKIYVNDKHRR